MSGSRPAAWNAGSHPRRSQQIEIFEVAATFQDTGRAHRYAAQHASQQSGPAAQPEAKPEIVTSGNVLLFHFMHVTLSAAVTEPLRKLGYVREINLPGTADPRKQIRQLKLQAGMRVKSKEEIAKTLAPKGIWFDHEMLHGCGGVYGAPRRIEPFLDERSIEHAAATSSRYA